jgi:hypothetical protein
MKELRPTALGQAFLWKKFCKYMEFNHSTLYYSPKGESAGNLDIMEEMDKYYINHPTAGVLTMVNMLVLKGISANPKRIRRLMRKKNKQTSYKIRISILMSQHVLPT